MLAAGAIHPLVLFMAVKPVAGTAAAMVDQHA
jgi:hypothetical protein